MNKRKALGLVMYIIIIVLLLSGCTVIKSESSDSEQKEGPNEITLTPVELFKGEGAKFQPFLGAMSGAFKLSYKGNKPNARLDFDLWENGKKVASSGSIRDIFFTADMKDKKEVEVIISIEPVSIEGQDGYSTIKVNTINDSSSSLATLTIPWGKQLTLKGLINYNEPHIFNADEAIYVWGLQGSSSNGMATADLSPESLSTIESGIIFTLQFED